MDGLTTRQRLPDRNPVYLITLAVFVVLAEAIGQDLGRDAVQLEDEPCLTPGVLTRLNGYRGFFA
jgi:hypothetical protein